MNGARRSGSSGRAARMTASIWASVSASGIRYSDHLEDDGATVFAHACRLGCECIVSKDRSHPYRSGPSKTWIKVKNPEASGVRRFEERG